MNRYERYKDSGIPWLGEVPEHWDVKRLKFLGDIILGLTYSPENITNEDNGTLVLRSSNIQNGKLVFEDNVFVNSDIPQKMITTEQDILICSRNGSRSLIGKCALIEKYGLNQTFGAFMTVFRTPYRKFVYYALNSEIFKSQLGLFLTSTINQLTTQVLGNFNIAFPPRDEQTAIAHYLDTKLGEIDTLIGKQQTLLEKLSEQRTAVITHAVTKGLNPAAPMKKSGVEWLGDVPAHWDVKKFKHLCKIITGYTPSKNNDENYDENGFLWVKPDNLNDFKEISDTKEKISVVGLKSNYLIPKDSILVCSIGTIGKMGVAMQDVITNQQINSFIFNELVNKSFSKYLIYSAKGIFEHMANDNVVRILNSNTQKNIFSPLPPLVEQAKIADYLDQETAKIDRLCDTVNQTIGRLKEYRTALITQAVTGKIKVTN
ncbi:restriction endonuclease subunit S [Haemophilus parahaemolyticus]|uniref:restriction endonuclease subunit S n=1 Tax=Haemophilus parahaemolyticus TaxID=735 RepID=UPI0028EAD50E|nr:restriction endonuclease subunit S [Haemophilus parahaemolyticus]